MYPLASGFIGVLLYGCSRWDATGTIGQREWAGDVVPARILDANERLHYPHFLAFRLALALPWATGGPFFFARNFAVRPGAANSLGESDCPFTVSYERT